MHQNHQSYDYYERPTDHRHGSRHEPQPCYSEVDDAGSFTDLFGDVGLGPPYHSSLGRNEGRRGTRDHTDPVYPSAPREHRGVQGRSHRIDNVGSPYPPTYKEHRGKGRASHYMDNVGSYYHSTHSHGHGEQGTHHHVDDKVSNNHCTHSKHHGKRSTHHHVDEREPRRRDHHHPKTSGGKKELREQLFRQALRPFSKRTGTAYPCTQTDIDFHRRDDFPARNDSPFVPVREATRELMWHNRPDRPVPSAEKAAIASLLSAAANAQETLGPDLAVKAFHDLDLVFFRGCLRTNVTVQWRADVQAPSRGYNEVWGICSPPRGIEKGQSRILLNASMIFKQGWTTRTKNPFESMIGTLLHEMCHAYEFVRSDRKLEPGDGHGKLFGTRIAVVHKRALRILGLWAIERGQPHTQHHFFMPGCEQKKGDDHGARKDDGGRKGASGKQESSGKQNDGRKTDGGKKDAGSLGASGSSIKPKRRHKGTDCVIM